MKKYYIHIGQKEEGAFTIEELKEKKIERDTMIWYEGLDKWLKAEHIEEFKQLFESLPPKLISPPPYISPATSKQILPSPFIGNKSVQTPSIKSKKIYLALGFLALALTGFGVWHYKTVDSIILSSNGDKVNVRQFPDVNAPVLHQLNRNEEVAFLNEKSSFRTSVTVNGTERTNFWYRVKILNNSNVIGWVHGDFLSFPSNYLK